MVEDIEEIFVKEDVEEEYQEDETCKKKEKRKREGKTRIVERK